MNLFVVHRPLVFAACNLRQLVLVIEWPVHRPHAVMRWLIDHTPSPALPDDRHRLLQGAHRAQALESDDRHHEEGGHAPGQVRQPADQGGHQLTGSATQQRLHRADQDADQHG